MLIQVQEESGLQEPPEYRTRGERHVVFVPEGGVRVQGEGEVQRQVPPRKRTQCQGLRGGGGKEGEEERREGNLHVEETELDNHLREGGQTARRRRAGCVEGERQSMAAKRNIILDIKTF